MRLAQRFFCSKFPNLPYMTFWVCGDPAPCMDSTKAVPPLMFSMSLRIFIQASIGTPPEPTEGGLTNI